MFAVLERTLPSAKPEGTWGLAVLATMLMGAGTPANDDLLKFARVVRGVLWALLFWQVWSTARRLWWLLSKPAAARGQVMTVLALVLIWAGPARAQGQFYAHDNYTRYELLEPGSHQFAITYYVTERRPGATVLLNQTRSGSAGSDISVFDPQSGRLLKFDYLSGAELAKDGTPGRFDPTEHYIRAQLPRPVPDGGEGRVKIRKTYADEKSYYTEGDDVVFKRSLGIARNAIVLPKGYRLVSSNVASQILTTPDGRVKVSFEHAHGYAAEVTIRARKGVDLAAAAGLPERAFDFAKSLFDLGPPESHSFVVTHEYLVTARGPRVALPSQLDRAKDVRVTDVDTGQPLKVSRSGKQVFVELSTPLTADEQSARLRIAGTLSEPGYRLENGTLVWECTLGEPRNTVLLPSGWDVAAVSVMATVATQPDGRVALQIYNGNPGPLRVTVRAVKR